MARTYVQQKPQTNEQLFNALVLNAVDFLDASIDNLDHRPKNSMVDFYTAIELFLKARLMLEHWTLILEEPGNAQIQKFSIGDFKSVYLDGSVKRLKDILNIKLDEKIIKNFKALGEHRNQIVHFAHTEYSSLQANKAGVVAQQWTSWHHLYNLLSVDWKVQFEDYQKDFARIHKKMLTQKKFLDARFDELSGKIEILKKRGIKVVNCSQCGLDAGEVKETKKWGDEYECLVCESHDVELLKVNDTLDCPSCKKPFEFFNPEIKSCPSCGYEINTNILIKLCKGKYTRGDDWWEPGGDYIAGCHECKHTPNSVFHIDGQWSCVSCFDRGWNAISCPHCDEYVTGDMDTIKFFACHKCADAQSNSILSQFGMAK
ncbi:TPA: hypothetical protein QH312_003446 [Enterobacter chengduensis]|uniref:hypothetical protein n=1 Tax=Enterobacter cloacae complex TaxID=354276 RepID=UPI0007503D8E|nr:MULTISPECIES: hypothetical protein [Enterobacter cloacae complex]KUQ36450.1 hypothetical protein AWI13_21830 [Enterobacter hormaechei subsp. xiangfangensis]MCM7425752.1 hypothetical protein [Enterobacter chengduensis]HDS5485934.1 hypothetical protein [Enterobacter chengduensis]HDS5490341.1 hypothetical protein [Enterobacter chengduensis]HDT2589044.1 hypothetical protein [Enterobacter chengduensis]